MLYKVQEDFQQMKYATPPKSLRKRAYFQVICGMFIASDGQSGDAFEFIDQFNLIGNG